MRPSYVWLVPEYTHIGADAATGFKFRIQNSADNSSYDLAKGAGGEYRYLFVLKDNGERKVRYVRLSRKEREMRFEGWEGTGNINQGRKGSFLYLIWRTESII